LNTSNGEENFLLDELRVNKVSLYLKKERPLVDEDFDANLNFDPS